MVLIHIVMALMLNGRPNVAHAQWMPRPGIPVRPVPVRPWAPIPYRPWAPPVPYRPGYVYPGWSPYWVWNPYAWQPAWWAWHWQVIIPWGQIGWMPNIPVGTWQCVAFNPYGAWFVGASPIQNQAAYNALWECGGFTWQASSCYVPPGYCQYYVP